LAIDKSQSPGKNDLETVSLEGLYLNVSYLPLRDFI
jgi:hypothetical protein